MSRTSEDILRDFFASNGVQTGDLEHVSDDDWTPEICLQAVIHSGRAISFIPDQFKTLELCEIAVGIRTKDNSLAAVARSGPYYLESMIYSIPIRHRTYALCMALAEDPSSILNISEVPYRLRTLEICLKIIGSDENGMPTQYADDNLDNPERWLGECPPEVQSSPVVINILKRAVRNGAPNGKFLKLMHNQPTELTVQLVQQYAANLRYCRVQTPEICMLALEWEKSHIGYGSADATIQCIQKEIGSDEGISMFVVKNFPEHTHLLAGLSVDAFIWALKNTIVGNRHWIYHKFSKQTRAQSLAIWRHNVAMFDVIDIENRKYVVLINIVDHIIALLDLGLPILSTVNICTEIMAMYESVILSYPALSYSRLWNVVISIREFHARTTSH